MTRAFATSLPVQRFDPFSTLAQPLRSDRALPDQEPASFAAVLREKGSTTPDADRTAASEPAPEDGENAPSQDADKASDAKDADADKPSETKDEADSTNDPEASQTDRAETPTRPSSTRDADPAASEPVQPVDQDNEPDAVQPASPGAGQAEHADAGDGRPVPVEGSEPQSPKAPATSEPSVARPESSRGAEGAEPRAQAEGARVELAPDAEAQAEESIRVETRFDAKIRDRIRNAAKIDLAALASEKLTTPDEHIPGDLRQAPAPAPQRTVRAEATPPPEPVTQTQTPPTPAPAIPVQQVEAAPSAARASERVGVPEPLPADAPAPTATSAEQQGTNLGARQDSGTQTHHPPAAPASPVPGVKSATTGAASFDKAINALRSLGAERAKPGAGAPQAKATPESRARPVLAQVSRGMASILRQQGGQLTLRLRPDALGELKITLRVQNGGVEATFKANNAQARELLNNSMSQLKETLEASGVRVDHLRVEPEHTRPQDAGSPHAERDGRPGDGSPQFENPSETGGRENAPHDERQGRRHSPHGRGPDQDAAESASAEQSPGPNAEALRDEAWIGLDTLA
jgi:flagellar hook-length control protein FliK